ncbi:MAG: PilC/PilY family type IV pilus protein [Ramlibacter sp.]|nr:PilC/PilY family type IV pilus protein [Ramlibacter sp.]
MKTVFRRCAAIFSLLCFMPVMAEDIDLFVGNSVTSTDIPNVLIILDNTANWNTAFVNEKAALVSVFNSLPANKFNVGLMMFTETGGGNSGNDGAYVRAAIRPMTPDTSTDLNPLVPGTKSKYAAMINALDQTGDKSNGGKIGKSMWEAYQYFKGLAPHAGNNKNKTDYTGNTSGNTQSNAIYALAANALTGKTGGAYRSPIDVNGCAKNYIIYISNGAAQDNTSDTTASKAALAAAGGSTTTIPISPSGSQDNVADEWARFMKKSDIGATVYTVDINKVTTGQGPGWTALLKSMAGQSSGRYFDVASSGTQILDALNDIFSEIQSVNSVFASVSLPVSVNTQGNYLNQVYVGMFRPDADAAPRWNGNLKQYKLGKTNGELRLQDADSSPAINNQTGFITECARSFWTPTALDTEFASREQGDCLTVANSRASNYPDGNIVEKGAQAYRSRATDSRTTYTCSADLLTCTTLNAFASASVSQAALGAASTGERDALISWAKGTDIDDEDLDGNSTTERRLTIHGDVVHSRPVALNFGSDDANANVVVFYGSNDGWFRAINGNRSNAIGSVPAGGELWSFMPPEFYSSIKRLRDNTTQISTPGNSGAGTAAKPYGMDGPITAFKGTIGGVAKAYVYASMRRGGRAIYAFDVTNAMSTPTTPTLKWKIGCSADGANCTTGMENMAQSWSSVRTFTTTAVGSGATPLLIFGGGYDTCEDTDNGTANHSCTSASKGNVVYVVNADTGVLVKAFSTGGVRGVIADVTFVRDSLGQVIYGYAADLGGDVYRITFSNSVGSWTMDKIASLGCATTAACAAPRKFMFAPSVVQNADGSYQIMIGSGDREKPLLSYSMTSSVSNYFFSFTDKPTVDPSVYPGATSCGSIICLTSLWPITTSATPTDAELATKQGWYLGLGATEQVVTSALTVSGTTTFSTHQPAVGSPGQCSANLGTTLVYNVSYKNAGSMNGSDARFEDVSGDGLPPSPVAGRVTLDDGSQVPFCIGCSKDSPLEGKELGGSSAVVQPKARLYWYIQK